MLRCLRLRPLHHSVTDTPLHSTLHSTPRSTQFTLGSTSSIQAICRRSPPSLAPTLVCNTTRCLATDCLRPATGLVVGNRRLIRIAAALPLPMAVLSSLPRASALPLPAAIAGDAR